MTDTERLEKLDRWMCEHGWDSAEGRVRFIDEWFPMHIRDWIDQLPVDQTLERT